jgi:predicted  nucleic acid-binding Zn-ribbon protein
MDAALQLIMDQFKELKSEISTNTAELKMDTCALGTGQEALKSEIGSITEDKVGNCMSTITEGLKTDMNDLWSEVSVLESRINEGQAEMEEELERQQKEVTSIVEQQTRHLQEGIEATRRELEA